jgi:hypothetical protein
MAVFTSVPLPLPEYLRQQLNKKHPESSLFNQLFIYSAGSTNSLTAPSKPGGISSSDFLKPFSRLFFLSR